MRHAFARRAPGLALTVTVAVAALVVNRVVPLVSALLVAIVLGALLRNLGLVPPRAEEGLRFSARSVLRLGVVLLGLQLSVVEVLDLGWGAIAVIVLTVAGTWILTLLVGRLMRVPRTLRLLLATGTAVCGASAVAAMAAVASGEEGRDREDVQADAATAVAAVTIFGTLAMLVLPPLAGALALDAHASGVWLGAGIHEVGQVVAAGGLVGEAALATAVVTKLGRVVLLAPLVAAVGYAAARRARRELDRRAAVESADAVLDGQASSPRVAGPALVPAFVLGFLALVVVRSFVPLPGPVLDGAATASTVLLTVAMVGLGSGVNVAALVRRGGPALLLGLVASVVAAGLALGGVLLLV
ncbi:YeiH family protein [Georgenia halophila]|uniref:YeiH family protein n=1 Tax=Georgenia halophila TaxID=620889 RepID=A0ABP8LGG6_9MICO